MKHWLVKTEPSEYSWDDLVNKGEDHWDGVRNYQARNNLRNMKMGDQVLFYHSQKQKAIVGIARVVKEAYQDPTTDDEKWVAVNLVPFKKLKEPVTLETIKQQKALTHLPLLKQSRLSVMPVDKASFEWIVSRGAL